MPSRWDYLFEAKPVPIIEHFLEEVSKLLATELQQWPLPIQELDLAHGQKFAALLEPGSKRPERAVFTEAFRLARWELLREFDAYDDYMRNARFVERGLAPEDRTALLLVSQWLVEQMVGIGEATEGRIRRPQLAECLERIERRLHGSPLLLA